MKVKEVLEKLQKCPLEYEVQTEGCDCIGDANGVIIDDLTNSVMLTRDGEVWNGYRDPDKEESSIGL